LVRLPCAADSCPWVGKLRTVLPFTNRDVIRDSAVQLGLTHQRGANGVGFFGVGDRAHAAVTRRPPVSLDTMVPRARGYAHDVGVWGLSVVQGPVFVAPCPNPNVTIPLARGDPTPKDPECTCAARGLCAATQLAQTPTNRAHPLRDRRATSTPR
jgi:hypothetical protein